MTRWMLVLSAVVAIALLALPAAADWDPDDPHKMHFPQLPDQNDEMGPGEFSWDVKLGDNLGHSVTLADDWLCTESGLVTDIHLWVSWQGDLVGDIGLIQVGIWSDLPDPDPADPQNWSMPQDLLWMGDVAPAPPDPNVPLLPMMFTVRPYGPPSPQGFFDPYGFVPPMYPDHLMTWQINIQLDPSTAFYQEEGTTYWLSVLMPAVIDPSGGTVQAGWKTSEDHWNDDSVFLPMIKYENGAARQPLPWQELRDPLEPSLSLDQAFVITADVDWGDAPDDPNDPNDYPTLAASGGAVHIADYLTFMGAFVDPEGDGQPSANADGDDLNDTWSAYGSDDEDGVSNWSVPLSPG
jgi:hypothetical protein